jgi:hypothetical protein
MVLRHHADSVINPAATSFELERYFTIAEPNVVAVDVSQADKVKKALNNLKSRLTPELVLIDDGSSISDKIQLSIVSPIEL